MGSHSINTREKLRNCSTWVYKVREKLYNEYVKGNKIRHRKKLYNLV